MKTTALAIVATLILASPHPARADEPSRDPEASRLLDEVAAAYRGLNDYADEGRIVVSTPGPGRSVEQSWPMSLSLSRPNRLSIDARTIRLVCDGQSLVTANTATKSYTRGPAPEAVGMPTIAEGSAGAVLLGGPGGRCPAVLLSFLFSPDVATTLLAGKTGLAMEADRDEAGQLTRVVRLDQPGGPDLLLGIDPETKLLRWIELSGGKAASIRWVAGEVSTRPADPSSFSIEPPAGFRQVEPLKAAPPAAP